MFAAVFLAIVMVLGSASPGAAETRIPQIWDAKQRLPKPEVLPLQRLRFLTTTDFFPFNFLDSDGRLAGFHVDLARAICEALELEDRCQIQALPFDELEAALDDGQGEALIAGLAITREAREKYLFSRSYLQFPARFVTPKDAVFAEPLHEKVAGKRVGVRAGTAHEQMLRDLFAEARVVTYSRREWLLGDLKAGKLDAVFGDGMRLGFWLVGPDAEGCCVFAGGPYLAPEYLGHGLAIAVRKDQPALAGALDYALQKIEERGTFAELYLRYFPVGFY
ncbi:transporter substrate-binding domain-containing protein [Chelativorans salis]|uniref:Transporter substrate-binding domain-containing protein n=1 Tax=Chelativorans salis TaxID=2978478 RepID=A0ABT2LIV2_9HYPH|nr:transporter substrate-binding domain-containing protein [Chelativorans sp. EGI FJ00035]MCT7374501.1 transporter substrate-binding domain-containing protein [Chelativorans sp. EGI FJ00035]